jgi:hypothetical protein
MIPFASLLDRAAALRRSPLARWIAAFLAIICWCALAMEFKFLLGESRAPRIAHAIVKLLGFFTAISNLLVGIILSAWALRPVACRRRPWFARVSAAAVVYIVITGVVYTLFLRQSHGDWVGWAVDIALHQVVPLGYPLYWFAILPKVPLDRRDVFRWLILPFLFAVASMVRGAITGAYTYPFLNVTRLGYPLVVLIIVLISLPFLGLGMIVARVSGVSGGDQGAA